MSDIDRLFLKKTIKYIKKIENGIMNLLLFLNGTPPLKSTLESIDFNRFFVVCADGAYNYLSAYCIPDILVGDFDSLVQKPSEETDLKAKKIIRLPSEKDFTDGHIAMLQLIGYYAKAPFSRQDKLKDDRQTIFIYGALGGYPDHELSNYSLLALSAMHNINSVIVSEKFNVHLAEGDFACPSKKGKRISLVPFTDSVHILSTRGLKYPIKDEVYDKLHIKGISNEATEVEIGYQLKSGSALIFAEN